MSRNIKTSYDGKVVEISTEMMVLWAISYILCGIFIGMTIVDGTGWFTLIALFFGVLPPVYVEWSDLTQADSTLERSDKPDDPDVPDWVTKPAERDSGGSTPHAS